MFQGLQVVDVEHCTLIKVECYILQSGGSGTFLLYTSRLLCYRSCSVVHSSLNTSRLLCYRSCRVEILLKQSRILCFIEWWRQTYSTLNKSRMLCLGAVVQNIPHYRTVECYVVGAVVQNIPHYRTVECYVLGAVEYGCAIT